MLTGRLDCSKPLDSNIQSSVSALVCRSAGRRQTHAYRPQSDSERVTRRPRPGFVIALGAWCAIDRRETFTALLIHRRSSKAEKYERLSRNGAFLGSGPVAINF